ncbi:hypothetical protein PILCRDRAFT_827477 [Piloderma croceum F 1598]|uniref:Uncharacterized protein n=1 Tax=Piloderma croceum (strain F 1598) TaxID=765440 RepID=A0A0C3ERP2_PILCF|nr:hypothetical protein PILCRDRAFT_827477 [Piloderma croceum F 1598]
MPRGTPAVKGASQLDARGGVFNDVGRDLHYHVNVTLCSHANSNLIDSRAEIPNIPEVDSESDSVSPLLERGIKLIKCARTYIVTSISAIIARFEL